MCTRKRSALRGDARRWQRVDLPPSQPPPIDRWLKGIAMPDGDDARVLEHEFSLAPALLRTDMLTAAYRAHRESRTVARSVVRGGMGS